MAGCDRAIAALLRLGEEGTITGEVSRLQNANVVSQQWYVYRPDGPPIGPIPTEAVAEAILAGRLSPDSWVAGPQGSRWLRASEVPVIASLLDGMPTRRSAILRRMDATTADAPPLRFDDTVQWTAEKETVEAPPLPDPAGPATERTPAHEPEGATPPSSSSPPPPPRSHFAETGVQTPRKRSQGA